MGELYSGVFRAVDNVADGKGDKVLGQPSDAYPILLSQNGYDVWMTELKSKPAPNAVRS